MRQRDRQAILRLIDALVVPHFPADLPPPPGATVPVARTALCLQLIAAAAASLLQFVLQQQYAVALPAWALVSLIGLFSAALTYWRRLPWWWLPIQAGFAPAILATRALHLPSWLFLLVFLLLASLFWTTFRTRVPLYFSGPAVWQAVAGLLPPRDSEADQWHFIDIGSGIGGLVLTLAEQREDVRCSGIELAPLPWLISRVRARLRGISAELIRGDYQHCKLAEFDVVFAYLSTAAMPALWQKARAEMRPGTLLLSYEFLIPDQAPDVTLQPKPDGPFLYGWYHR